MQFLMKQMISTVFALCGVLASSALDVAAWRGETVSAWLPDGETVGTPPRGVSVKVGTALDVKYAPVPLKPERTSVKDRVVWDSSAEGPRVVQVSVAADAAPGDYRLGDVLLRVVDRVLPPAKDWSYHLNLWQHPWAVSRYYGVKPFSPTHYAKMEPLWRQLAAAGQKALTVTLVDLPWNHQCFDGYESMVKYVRRADGTTCVDWTCFDAYVAFGRSCGIGPNIDCFTMCPWEYQVSWLDEHGRMKKAKAVPGTPFFQEYWGPFLAAFVAHLKEKGWFADTSVAVDELSPEDLRNVVAFLRERAPGLKISMAGNRRPNEFDGIKIDNYSQGISFIPPDYRRELDRRRGQGRVTTFYVCCWPAKPNTFMSSDLAEAFWCGAYPAMSGFDGFLRWAWNSWPADPCEDATYDSADKLPSGDTFLVYPDGSPSARFLSLWNGVQQAEKFNLLKKQGIRTAELDALAEKYDFRAILDGTSGDLKALARETRDVLNK